MVRSNFLTTILKNTPILKVPNLIIFSKFRELHNNHHHSVLEHFQTSERSLLPICNQSPIGPPQLVIYFMDDA